MSKIICPFCDQPIDGEELKDHLIFDHKLPPNLFFKREGEDLKVFSDLANDTKTLGDKLEETSQRFADLAFRIFIKPFRKGK